jgi:Ca2+-binding RTX toxin-like protein
MAPPWSRAGAQPSYNGNGGGLYSYNRDMGPDPDVDTERTIRNSTIIGNVASGSGGGIQAYLFDQPGGPGDILKLSSTIVANNTAPEEPDLGDTDITDPEKGSFELGFSLIENTGDATITQSPAGSNLLGVDPALGPLADNGGPTQTHAPSFTSPVIDKGIGNGLPADQRGSVRTFDAVNFANAAGGDGTDIGSVELLPGGRIAAAPGQCKGKVENLLFAPGAPITGSDANDVIVGTAAKDQIASGKGKDSVCAQGGNDSVKAGAGKDNVAGQTGKDRVKGNGGNDKLQGNAGRDTLKGGGGKDTLKGGGGKDKLVGGPGKDKLRGGGGKDSERQ